MEFAEYIPTPKVENVWCYDNFRKTSMCGTLCLTGHNMIVYADDTSLGEVWMPYKNIDLVERRIGIDKGTLVVKCKDLKQYSLTIPGVDEATNVAYSAETLSNVADPRLQFPYFYRPKFEFSEDGWNLYNIEERLSDLTKEGTRWRISDVNMNFHVCRTYASRIIVPNDLDDKVLIKSAKFRQGSRFPVMSYCHRNGATIIRSSQPLVGSNNRRCKEDEKLLNSMLGPSHKGYILDVRSVQSATQAKAKGGGYEGDQNYSRWKRIHMNLKSHFVQQESFIKIIEACNDTSGNMDRWLSKLESSEWMEYVKRALEASCLVAQSVDRQEWSVLVHGAEGLDSTLTVTSVAQIILDPDCRTIRGLLSLIDREWINGGHPFTARTFRGPFNNGKQREEGPVFSIFLECVFQLLQQFPLSFEYTSKLLVDIRRHSYSSQFGTFLFNNVQERIRGKLQSQTVCLWTYILSPSVFINYVNPLYRRLNHVIWPSVAPQSMDFWDEYYIPHLMPKNPIVDRVKLLQERRMELEILKVKVSQLTESNQIEPKVETILDEPLLKISDAFEGSENSTSTESAVSDNSQTVTTSQTEFDPVVVPNIESPSFLYVPIAGDVTQNMAADSHSVNSQPDLLEDLLSFVDTPNSSNNLVEECPPNLPDLDDLAIDSPESNSPDAVSPIPS